MSLLGAGIPPGDHSPWDVMSPAAPLNMTVSLTSVLMTLTVLRSADQSFCGMSLNWGFSSFFVMIRKTPVEGQSTKWLMSISRSCSIALSLPDRAYQGHTLSVWLPVANWHLISLLRWRVSGFQHFQGTLFIHTPILGKNPPSKERGARFLHRLGFYTEFSEFLYTETGLFFLHSCIYSVVSLYLCERVGFISYYRSRSRTSTLLFALWCTSLQSGALAALWSI